MLSDPHWGSEFADVSEVSDDAGEQELVRLAGEQIETGSYRSALDSLHRLSRISLRRAVGYRELAGCLHMLTQDDPCGALARLKFALALDVGVELSDAAASSVAVALEAQDNARWAAMAWAECSDGQQRVEALVTAGLDPQWLREEAYEALEALVFDRADDLAQSYWSALGALLAAQQVERSFEDDTIAEFADAAVRSHPDNPRAAAMQIQVLLALERDDSARSRFADAVDRLRDRPQALLEFLVAADADRELADEVDAAYETLGSTPGIDPRFADAIARRPRPEPASSAAPAEGGSFLEGLGTVVETLVRPPRLVEPDLVADLVLGEPPRRTDQAWLEIKARGDEAFRRWMVGVGLLLLLGVLALLWLF